MAPTEPGTAHSNFPFGMFEDHGRILGTDLATKEAIYPTLVTLMVLSLIHI